MLRIYKIVNEIYLKMVSSIGLTPIVAKVAPCFVLEILKRGG